jgi:DNA-binding transcriptional ArsR family regulator
VAPVPERSEWLASPNKTFAVGWLATSAQGAVGPSARVLRAIRVVVAPQRRGATAMEPQRLRRYLRHGLMPQLAAFDAVMRLGSVTRASQALHMAQPTVSGHLRKLSDTLGVPLFDCDGRRMLPTAPAHALHEGTRDLFATLHDIECALAPWRETLRPSGDPRPVPDAARPPGSFA